MPSKCEILCVCERAREKPNDSATAQEKGWWRVPSNLISPPRPSMRSSVSPLQCISTQSGWCRCRGRSQEGVVVGGGGFFWGLRLVYLYFFPLWLLLSQFVLETLSCFCGCMFLFPPALSGWSRLLRLKVLGQRVCMHSLLSINRRVLRTHIYLQADGRHGSRHFRWRALLCFILSKLA